MLLQIIGALTAFFCTLTVIGHFGNVLADGVAADWIGTPLGIIVLLTPFVAAVLAYTALGPKDNPDE